MAIGKKIRIYDLARELKQDAKRVMEDLRREGADVSVPSNSVSAELAEKIRLKYFPKTETAPKRAIKVIKATKKDETAPAEETAVEEPIVPVAEPVEAVEAEEPPAVDTETLEEAPATTKPRSYKLQKKAVAPAEPVAEAEPEVAEAEPAVEQPESETVTEPEAAPAEPAVVGTGTTT